MLLTFLTRLYAVTYKISSKMLENCYFASFTRKQCRQCRQYSRPYSVDHQIVWLQHIIIATHYTGSPIITLYAKLQIKFYCTYIKNVCYEFCRSIAHHITLKIITINNTIYGARSASAITTRSNPHIDHINVLVAVVSYHHLPVQQYHTAKDHARDLFHIYKKSIICLT